MSASQTSNETPVVIETSKRVGALIGTCKWFSDNRGYGFITVCSEPGRGTDVFVHFSGLRPLNNHHRRLHKGEYVSFDAVQAEDRQQAVNVTGVLGGPLMCDHEYPGGGQAAAVAAPPVGTFFQLVPAKAGGGGGGGGARGGGRRPPGGRALTQAQTAGI